MADVRKIAVARLGAMGDILFTTPALRALKRRYPGSHITYLAVRKWRFLLKRNPAVDRVAALRWREPEALGALRRERFDLVINLHEFDDGARVCQALQAAERRGHRWIDGRLAPDQASRLLVKDTATLMELHRRRIHYPALYCRIAGVETDDYRYDFDPGPWAAWRARRFMQRAGLHDPARRPIALHVDSRGMPTKRWPNESVRQVVRALPERRFILIGYRPDRAATRELEGEANIIASYHDISMQAEIMRRCALFVGIDSGPRQVAAAVGTPAVCLFGPRPASLLPAFPGDLALEVDAHCAPCFQEVCPRDARCMDALRPERIVEAIRQALASHGERNA